MKSSVALHILFVSAIAIALLSTLAASSLGIGVDSTPPVTSAETEGASGSNGWNISAVNVTLRSVDGGSGVNYTRYSLDGAAWQTYQGAVHVAGDGIHQMRFFSVDKDNNSENVKTLNVSIDVTRPSLALGQSNGSIVGSSNFRVTWTSSDATSGVDYFEILSDGNLFDIIDNSSSSDRVTNLADGWHNITVRAYDRAGNFAEKNVSVKVWADQADSRVGTDLLIGIGAIGGVAVVVVLLLRGRRKESPPQDAREKK